MTKLLLLAALAVGFVAFAPTASAADKAKKKKAEAPATVEGQFKALDTNADKKLSLDEFKERIYLPVDPCGPESHANPHLLRERRS